MTRRIATYPMILLLGVAVGVVFVWDLPAPAQWAVIFGSLAVVAGLGWLLLRRHS